MQQYVWPLHDEPWGATVLTYRFVLGVFGEEPQFSAVQECMTESWGFWKATIHFQNI